MSILSFSLLFFLITFSSGTTTHCHNETGRCYWMGTGSISWDDARTGCQSEDGDLAVMETEELWDFVTEAIGYGNSGWTHVGLTDETQESDFRWVNRAPMYYSRFADGEPNTQRTEKCVSVNSGARWADGPCSVSRSFICSSTAPACSEARDGCTTFPIAFMGKYTGPYGPSDWHTAKSHCEALGQKLMTIDSPEEEDHVMQVLQPDSRIFLGLSDEEIETVFRTTDGLTPPWTGWKSDQPAGRMDDGPGVRDCITRRSEDGQWEDYGCTEELEYYCEGPEFSIDGRELNSTDLIDDDTNSCVNLTGSDGCSPNKIVAKAPWVDKEVNVTITTSGRACADVTVYWKVDWQTLFGNYKKCLMVTKATIIHGEYTCNYICDIRNAAMTEIVMSSRMLASVQPAICDVLIHI